jgi:hypothetical protein
MCAQSKPDAEARPGTRAERRSETPLDCIRIVFVVRGTKRIDGRAHGGDLRLPRGMEKLESLGGDGHEDGHRVGECDRCTGTGDEKWRVGELGSLG